MPEKPKEKKELPEKDADSSWEKDQKQRGYYYDDACGYEDYDPEKDEDEEE